MDTTIYICADGTLTYGPAGGRDKIIKQALPVGFAPNEEVAKKCITAMGRKSYNVAEADPYFSLALKGKPIKEGYGPTHRYYYSGPEFIRNDVDSLSRVMNRFEDLIHNFDK